MEPSYSKRPENLQAILVQQAYVWYALMMHDIKTRYFGNGLGMLFSMAWPMAHMGVILAMNSGRIAPYGDSIVLYAATGVIPFMAFNYPSRFLCVGTVNNRQFLNYTIINVFDIILSRAVLELMSFCVVIFLFLIVLTLLLDINVVPVDVPGAIEALFAALFLGIGIGFLNSVIALLWPFWITASVLIIILFWATCGLLINPNQLPNPYRFYMSFNPTLHAVEWMRMSYYPGYVSLVLDKTYLIDVGMYCLASGVLAVKLFERNIRK